MKSGHDRYQRVTRSFSFTLYVDEQSISMMINTGTVVSCTDDVTTSKHKQTVSILKRKKKTQTVCKYNKNVLSDDKSPGASVDKPRICLQGFFLVNYKGSTLSL